MGDAGAVKQWLTYVGVADDDQLFFWPPDVFAIAAAFLKRTGGYTDLVNGRIDRNAFAAAGSIAAGQEWRKALAQYCSRDEFDIEEAQGTIPPAVKNWTKRLFGTQLRSFHEAAQDAELEEAALHLCVASDVACEGIGVSPLDDEFVGVAQDVLGTNNNRTLCLEIDDEKLAVLPKQHTPQRGCTIRSLTHHLALYVPFEIDARWNGPYKSTDNDPDRFNLLLLPWPRDVQASDFRAEVPAPMGDERASFRYFEFNPPAESPEIVGDRVEAALKQARVFADTVHGIVLPELALDEEQFKAIERIAVRERAMIIAGVRGRDEGGMSRNQCIIQPYGISDAPAGTFDEPSDLWDKTRRNQGKHHRWCLDRNQVLQYELGGRLPASKDCWEKIDVGDRSVNFMTLTAWLTTCALICEDLARQEPVAEVIRAVGPNLVIALLMDGPQLRNRWSARYASVLADDPGTSVLSLTSIGMVQRSNPAAIDGGERPASRPVIGLWRDSLFGDRELVVDKNDDACVLSLVYRSTTEYTLDSRNCGGFSHVPVYAGHFPFKIKEKESG